MLHSIVPLVALIGVFAPGQDPIKPANHAYKVAAWYSFDEPVATLKIQVYDLSKNEFDEPTVNRWFREILDHHPRYGAYIRDLTTEGLPGVTEAERLQAAIDREKQRWAELQRQPSKPIPRIADDRSGRTGQPRSRTVAPARLDMDRPTPGSPGGLSNPPTSPFPVPYRSGPR